MSFSFGQSRKAVVADNGFIRTSLLQPTGIGKKWNVSGSSQCWWKSQSGLQGAAGKRKALFWVPTAWAWSFWNSIKVCVLGNQRSRLLIHQLEWRKLGNCHEEIHDACGDFLSSFPKDSALIEVFVGHKIGWPCKHQN